MLNRDITQATSKPKPVREPSVAPRVLPAHALFRGARTLVIELQGDRYQLRITRQGKLILTK